MPFSYRITITYFKNTSFIHIMEYLSATFNPSKTIIYLIQILYMDFDIPWNIMATDTLIVCLWLS